MSAIDPSYIRNIRDGLKSEQIEANNLEALPEGLVGVYDSELFTSNMNWKERQQTLEFFLVFALAQKEVSPDFASTILVDKWCKVLANENETAEDKRFKKVNEFIQIHSKRFTSDGEGKIRLYHERFRVYILQKVSEVDLAQFNQLFILLCESELKNNTEKDIPEKERYALEFLSTHYFISAMQGEKICLNKKSADSLKNLAYDQAYWERQVKASKGFEWSKKMLGEMMRWASKFDEEEVIECALNKVDLYHQEQNDAPRIVQLVADGDIETALQRIESFGGTDKEGLQRKFILYMLCLMELTLLDSKDKEHSKGSIEKILKHFDKNILAEQPDLLNWNDFFPSYLVFQLVSSWHAKGIMNINQNLIGQIETSWIEEMGPYNKTQLKLIETIADFEKSTNLYYFLAIEYVKISEIDKAFSLRNKSFDFEYQDKILGEIILQAFIQGNDEIYNSSISEISHYSIKNAVEDLILIEKAKKNIFLESDIKLLSKDRLVEIAFELIKNNNIVISDKIIKMLDSNIDSNYITLNFALAKKEISENYYQKGIDRIISINKNINQVVKAIENNIEQLKKVKIQTTNFNKYANENLTSLEKLNNLFYVKNHAFIVHTILHFFSIKENTLAIELLSNFSKNDNEYLENIKSIFEFKSNISSKIDTNVIFIDLIFNIKCSLLNFDRLYILVKLSKIFLERGNIEISNILIQKAKQYCKKYFDIKFDYEGYIMAINLFFDYYSKTYQYNEWLDEFNSLFRQNCNIWDNERKIKFLLNHAKTIDILKDEINKTINKIDFFDLSNFFYQLCKIDFINTLKLFINNNFKKLIYSYSKKPDEIINIKSNIALQFLRSNKLNYFLKLESNSRYMLEISIFLREEGNLDTSIVLLKELFSIQYSRIQPLETYVIETLLFDIYLESLNHQDISFTKRILKFIEGQFFPNYICYKIERSFNSLELKHQIKTFLFLIGELIKFKIDMNVAEYLLLVKNKVNDLIIKNINLSKKANKSEKKDFDKKITELSNLFSELNNIKLNEIDLTIKSSNLASLKHQTLWGIYKDFNKGYYSDVDLKNIKEELNKYSKLNYDCDLNLIKLSMLNVMNDYMFDFSENLNFDRYNRILNLQWAIDIKKQLPN
jgi:hypothetical protein